MSYDLFLKPRTGMYDQERLLAYFRSSRCYEIEGQHVWYRNEDTGVYFSFDVSHAGDGDEAGPAASYPVSFHMNFFRPSFFVSEAEPELSCVVEEFDFTVSDPQTDGMGEGDYDASRFVSGWEKGNELAYSVLLRDPSKREGLAFLPASRLERIWRWNFERGQQPAGLEAAVFVPRIFFLRQGDSVVPAVIWSDGTPMVFPNEIDAVVVSLTRLAPRTLFRRKEVLTVVPWTAVRPHVERFGRLHGDTVVACYDKPPRDVVAFLRALPPPARDLVTIGADSVLDAELVTRYAG